MADRQTQASGYWIGQIVSETWDVPGFIRNQRLLDRLLHRDFDEFAEMIQAHFPNTPNLLVRVVDLVPHYADELCDLYTQPPIRAWQGLDGAGKIARSTLYEDLRVDKLMNEAQRAIAVHQGCAIFPMRTPGGIKFEVAAPWRVNLLTRRPTQPIGYDTLGCVEIAIPIETTEFGVIRYGRVRFTATEARIVETGEGWFNERGSNPFGRIPIVIGRLVDPLPGRPWAPPHDALLNEATAQSVQLTDSHLLAKFGAWGEKVISGVATTDAGVTSGVGPDKVRVLSAPDGGHIPKMEVVQPQLNLAQLWNWSESQMKGFAGLHNLSTDAFLKVNTAMTASAREANARVRAEAKVVWELIMSQVEKDFATLAQDAMTLLTSQVYASSGVDVAIHYPSYYEPIDQQNDSQALVMYAGSGITTIAEALAERKGLPLAVARSAVLANRLRNRAMDCLADPACTEDCALAAGELLDALVGSIDIAKLAPILDRMKGMGAPKANPVPNAPGGFGAPKPEMPPMPATPKPEPPLTIGKPKPAAVP